MLFTWVSKLPSMCKRNYPGRQPSSTSPDLRIRGLKSYNQVENETNVQTLPKKGLWTKNKLDIPSRGRYQ